MQKKILALAVAGLVSGAAFAQTNVQIYGVVDAFYGNVKASGFDSVNVVNSGGLSGSRIGFRGTEDLGNGLKAVFVLEYALANDVGAGIGDALTTTTARQQYIGLTGNWGTAVAGRLQTTGFDFSNGGYNALAGSALDPHGEVTVGTLITTGSRANNAVAYISPNFSGFTFAANHSRISEVAIPSAAVNTEHSSANLLSATYENGPIKAGYVYSKISDAANVSGDDIKENALGLSYNFGIVKLGAAWQNRKTDATNARDKSWLLSAAAPVGPGTLAFTYAKQDLDAVSNDEKAWAVAYLYPLSKRTTAYTGYERVTNQGNVSGDRQRTLAVGLRHTF